LIKPENIKGRSISLVWDLLQVSKLVSKVLRTAQIVIRRRGDNLSAIPRTSIQRPIGHAYSRKRPPDQIDNISLWFRSIPLHYALEGAAVQKSHRTRDQRHRLLVLRPGNTGPVQSRRMSMLLYQTRYGLRSL